MHVRPSFHRVAAGFAALALLTAGALAHAQGYPNRPVKMIVPFPPGQATDIVARLVADRLSAAWGQGVVVENRGGGGGVPALVAGRDAAADGYTITFGTSGTIGVNPGIYSKLPYDPIKDFAMVGGVFTVPLMIVAHPTMPQNTLRELIDAAKKSPGTINWAVPGTGTSQHLTGELFKSIVGIDLVGIPYKGSGPAVTDVLGGQVPMMFDSLASALPHIKGGKLKAIAMTTLKRVPQLPEVPTVAESGFPGFEGVGWGGLIVPIATPKDIIEKIAVDSRKVLNDPANITRIIDRGAIVDPRGPAEFGEFVKAEIVKWAAIAKKSKIQVE